jgi:hypothetical protein
MTSGKKQDPNAEEWSVDVAFQHLTRLVGPGRAIYALTEAALSGRLQVTCRRFVVTRNGELALASEGIVRPDFWRDHLTFAFDKGRARVRPLKALDPGEYRYTLPARTVQALWPASSAVSKPPKQTVRLDRPQGAADGSRAGSVAAWLGELYPSGTWRLATAIEIHRNIERTAKKRKLNRWPSYTAVRRELRKRQA